MNNPISANIRMFRESKGYSQEYMANQLGLTQQAYSRMERHPEGIPLKRLYDLCEILQVKIVELIEENRTLGSSNFNHHGGEAGKPFNFSTRFEAPEKELYERYIAELREEIHFLRSILIK